MKKIVYTQADGVLAVVHPVINTRTTPPGAEDAQPEDITEDAAFERAMKRLPEDAIDVRIIEADDIPADRSFRNAWVHDGTTITHDMVKAREIHRARLRSARAPLLAELDIAYQRADERSDAGEKASIAARKQALRDITKHPDIDRAKTIDDLKKIGLT